MTTNTVFKIFNPSTGKSVGDTTDPKQADYINSNYMGIMKALPFGEYLAHLDKLRAEGNKSPYL